MTDKIRAGRVSINPGIFLSSVGFSKDHSLLGVTIDERQNLELVISGPMMPEVEEGRATQKVFVEVYHAMGRPPRVTKVMDTDGKILAEDPFPCEELEQSQE